MKSERTKEAPVGDEDDPLDREIDFSRGRPNPYWLGVVNRKCVRLLKPDIAEAFPDDASVNDALRAILRDRSAAMPQKVSANTAAAPKKKAR
jgi:hypothetical protein